MLVRRKLGEEIAANLKIDWKNPHVICIAESYSKIDIDTVEVVPVRLELFKYRYYNDGIFSLEPLNTTESQEELMLEVETSSGLKEAVKTLTDHSDRDSVDIQSLFQELRSRILQIDEDIKEKTTTVYVAYRLVKNFAELHIRRSHIAIHVRATEYSDPQNKIEVVPESYGWTLSRRFSVRNSNELDYALQLIEQSYKDIL